MCSVRSVGGADVGRHAAGAAIDHDVACASFQSVVERDRERVFFADVVSVFVDDRESVGVWVLAENRIRTEACSGDNRFLQVDFRWFRGSSEQTIGRAAHELSLTAEGLKEDSAEHRAGAVVAVEHDFVFLGSNGVGVDGREHRG